MKLTKNYLKKIIQEQILVELQALDNLKQSQLANNEFKTLYVMVRNEIFNYKKHYMQTFPDNFVNGILKQDVNRVSFSSAIKSYKPTENFNLVGRDLVFTKSQNFKILKLNFQGDPFKLSIINDDTVGADIVADENGLFRIRFNPKFLFDDENEFKSMLQHELQHIIDYASDSAGGIVRDEGEEAYWKSVIEYLSKSHEIGAHARQAAYIYYKSYSKDEKVDINKLLSINNKMLKTFEAYLKKFNPQNINKELMFLTNDEKEKAIQANQSFIYLLNEYFKLYKNNNY